MRIYYYIAVACIKIYNFTDISWFNSIAFLLNEKHDLGLMGNSFSKEESDCFAQMLEVFNENMVMPARKINIEEFKELYPNNGMAC